MTTHDEVARVALRLFEERGFDETTIDDIVAEVGIGRRTFFRYFGSKNELPWGDFDELLEAFNDRLEAMDPDEPVMDALRIAIVEFNTFPESEAALHRGRMRLLFEVPSLSAYSMLRYAAWRDVVAGFIAKRLGVDPEGLTAQTAAWACLGMCIGVYQQWLDDDTAELHELFDEAFRTAGDVFGVG